MSSPDIAGILEHSKELDRLRKEQVDVLVDINKMHKKLQAGESLFNSLTRKEENPEKKWLNLMVYFYLWVPWISGFVLDL